MDLSVEKYALSKILSSNR